MKAILNYELHLHHYTHRLPSSKLPSYYPLAIPLLASTLKVAFLSLFCIMIQFTSAYYYKQRFSELAQFLSHKIKKAPRPSKSSRSPKRYINYQVLQRLCLRHQTEHAHRGTTSPPELLPDIRVSDYAGCQFLYHAEYELATSQALWHHL